LSSTLKGLGKLGQDTAKDIIKVASGSCKAI
jgi:hypothetical protein